MNTKLDSLKQRLHDANESTSLLERSDSKAAIMHDLLALAEHLESENARISGLHLSAVGLWMHDHTTLETMAAENQRLKDDLTACKAALQSNREECDYWAKYSGRMREALSKLKELGPYHQNSCLCIGRASPCTCDVDAITTAIASGQRRTISTKENHNDR